MDNIVLLNNAVGGSPINIGSWLMADPGPDFANDFVEEEYTEGAGHGRARRISRTYTPRRMKFPLILASSGYATLLQLEARLRRMVAAEHASGWFMDIQPQGTPSAEVTRFRVLGGRWVPAYGIRMNEIARSRGTLEVVTEPFGFWPTWITLADVGPSVSPVVASWAAGSVIGDAEPFVRIIVQASMTGLNYPQGSWYNGGLIWGVYGGRDLEYQTGQSTPHIKVYDPLGNWLATSPIGSFAQDATLNARYGPTVMHAMPSQNLTTWTRAFNFFCDGSAGAMPGRWRAWALLKNGATALPYYALMDVVELSSGGSDVGHPIATGNPVATIPPAGASGLPGIYGPAASPGYHILDMGYVKIPQLDQAAVSQKPALRIWLNTPTSNMGVASTIVSCAGVLMQPADADHGVFSDGGMYPSTGNPGRFGGNTMRHGGYLLDSELRRFLLLDWQPSAIHSEAITRSDISRFYRGNMPALTRINQSGALFLSLLPRMATHGGANASINPPPTLVGGPQILARIEYRPRFAFIRGGAGAGI